MDQLTLITIASLAFVLSGTVKGVVGIGLPTTAIGLMTLVLSPRDAMALVMFPMIVTNAWQVWRGGYILKTARKYALFAVVLFIGVAVTTLAARDAPDRLLFGVLGVTILIFVAVNLAMRIPPLPLRFDRAAQVGFGIAAGIMGGLTAVWGPPMLIYLTSKHIPKEEFVRATGFLIFVGSLPLCAGYIKLGFLDGPLSAASLAMLFPTLLGFTIGEALRNRMSQERFRTVLLFVFLGLGLNLLRRALWG